MVTAQLFALGAIATFACVAAANPSPSIEQIKNLLARQNNDHDSTERFTIIQSGESTPATYCSNQTWVDQLNRCLVCTNREDDDDIWEDYGSSVSAAVRACSGQTATPGAVLSTASATGTETASGASIATISGTRTSTANIEVPTSVSDCHTHAGDLYCMANGVEWEFRGNVNVNNAPASYDNCRASGGDGDEITCIAADGSQVRLERERSGHMDDDNHNHGSSTMTPTATSNPSVSNTGGTAGGASGSTTFPTSTQGGSASRFGGSSIGGVLGLILAVFAV